MAHWRWNEFYDPDTKTTKDSLSVFEKVFLDDKLKKQKDKESQNNPENNPRRGILKHIFGIFN